eukprot:5663614-Amphidinium_carterae.1
MLSFIVSGHSELTLFNRSDQESAMENAYRNPVQASPETSNQEVNQETFPLSIRGRELTAPWVPDDSEFSNEADLLQDAISHGC